MKASGYRFYTTMGCVMAALLFLTGLKYPTHLYSPGDLTKKHETLRCKACHAPFQKVPTESCQKADCHPVGKIGKKATLKDLHDSPKAGDCLQCHTDHKGLEGKITKPFDHSLLAQGKDCRECHETEYRKGHKDLPRERCLDCHNTLDWKKTTFRHADRKEACADCHARPKDALHANLLGSCSDCHRTEGVWKDATLDHNKYFPLTGKHAVPCVKCHDSGNYKKYTCMNCHEHATRGLIREHQEEGIRDFGDCLRCHRIRINGNSYGTAKTHEGIGGEEGEHEEHEHRRGRGKSDDD